MAPAQPLLVKRTDIEEFNKLNPKKWFNTLDLHFASLNITDQAKKFTNLQLIIDQKIQYRINNLIKNPPTDPYDAAKDELIKQFSPSDGQRLQQFHMAEIGDATPSEFFYDLSEMADEKLSETMIIETWLNKLPEHVGSAVRLAHRMGTATQQQLLQTADQYFKDKVPQRISAIEKESTTEETSNQQEEKNSNDIAQITRNRLPNRFPNPRAFQNSRRPPHQPQQYGGRGRGRNFNQRGARGGKPLLTRGNAGYNDHFCFYHNNFGAKAFKCEEGCAYQQTSALNANDGH